MAWNRPRAKRASTEPSPGCLFYAERHDLGEAPILPWPKQRPRHTVREEQMDPPGERKLLHPFLSFHFIRNHRIKTGADR